MHKSIYKLRQALHAWYKMFSSKLLELGFIVSQSDHLLFIHHGNITLYLLFYIDNISFTSNNNIALLKLIIELTNSFKMNVMGLLAYFICIQVDLPVLVQIYS